ncbi:MAG: hypothetical protein BWY87_00892 [Deltaproteobacteria bacterium ADurb.Bin510]|nr:MAG: hypothetical protein BWY87_00892 [Deltaproteobacteria bacterium ADurb.Bin510]
MALTPKILIVGSNLIFRQNLRDLLERLEYSKLNEARDATVGWEMINNLSPEIVIAQWDMPEMSGLALLKLIRSDAQLNDMPVMLWAETITKTDVIRAGEAGCNVILLDPVSIEVLDSKIRILLEFEMSPATKKARVHMERGDQLMRQERYPEALAEYSKVLDTLESAEVYYNIGYIKTAKGEYDEALAAFRKATQLNQMFAKAYKAMAEVCRKMGNLKMAEKYLQLAGEIYLEREMHESAESIFNEIIEINPETLNVYNSLGIIYRRQNRHQDAITLYEKAVKIDPYDENIHFNMGRAYLDLHNPEMAQKCFAKALKINPRFELARNMLAAIESSSRSD